MNPVWNETVLLADFCQNDIFFGYPASLYVCDSFSENDSFCVQFQCQTWIFGLPALKRFALFVKKKTWLSAGNLQTCKKTFFGVSKSVKPHHFFFFHFQEFSLKLRKKKHNFHFQIAKNFIFVHQKKKFFGDFTADNRHLLNSRETVTSFTAVSLKLTWNSKNGQSFTETGCQKYVVFGMKSAKSTVSAIAERKYFL